MTHHRRARSRVPDRRIHTVLRSLTLVAPCLLPAGASELLQPLAQKVCELGKVQVLHFPYFALLGFGDDYPIVRVLTAGPPGNGYRGSERQLFIYLRDCPDYLLPRTGSPSLIFSIASAGARRTAFRTTLAGELISAVRSDDSSEERAHVIIDKDDVQLGKELRNETQYWLSIYGRQPR